MNISVCADIVKYRAEFFENINHLTENGADAIEFWKWSNKDIEKLKNHIEAKKLIVSGFCLDSSNEELSSLCLGNLMSGGMIEEFDFAMGESIKVARKLQAGFLIATVGDDVDGLSYDEQINNIKECIKSALDILEKNNIILLLEPICRDERPGYLIPKAQDMLNIIKDINSKNVKLLYDVFHQFNTGDYSVEFILENIEYIGHIHIANAIDRYEPKDGKIDFTKLYTILKKSGYEGYVGLEYTPNENDISKVIKELKRY